MSKYIVLLNIQINIISEAVKTTIVLETMFKKLHRKLS